MDKKLAKSKLKCDLCRHRFSSVSNLNKHRRNIHQIPAPDKTSEHFKCSECDVIFTTLRQILRHYQEAHSEIVIAKEKKTFESLERFHEWKEAVENNTAAKFVTRGCNTYNGQSFATRRFRCHRTGVYKPRGTNIRSLKVAGSIKIGHFCPASMTVRTNAKSGAVSVDFISTHVGHKCEPARLRLSKTERSRLAAQMARGVPKESILADIATISSPTNRFSLTTRKDLHNIAAAFNIHRNQVAFREDEDAHALNSPDVVNDNYYESVGATQVDNDYIESDPAAQVDVITDQVSTSTKTTTVLEEMKAQVHVKFLSAIGELEKATTCTQVALIGASLDMLLSSLTRLRQNVGSADSTAMKEITRFELDHEDDFKVESILNRPTN